MKPNRSTTAASADAAGFAACRAADRGDDHVIELDGLRGMLAVWVALTHILLWCGFANAPGPAWFSHWLRGFLYSPASVETFYILSGFAISYLLCTRRPSYSGFMTGRLFRIYPVYVVCLALGVACSRLTSDVLSMASWHGTSYFNAVRQIAASEHSWTLQHLLAHAVLLHGVLPVSVLPASAAAFVAPAWSISVEWQYYLVAFAVLYCARSALGVFLLAFVALLAIRYEAPWVNPLPAFLPLALPMFLVGIASYHLYAWFVAGGRRRSGRNALVVAVIAAAVTFLRWHRGALLLWVAAFGSLFVESEGWAGSLLVRVREFLRHRVLQFLGRLSYPIYLVHWPLIILFLFALVRLKPDVRYPEAVAWLVLLGCPLILGLSYVLHRWIEAPCMRLGRQLAAQAPAPPSAGTPLLVRFHPLPR